MQAQETKYMQMSTDMHALKEAVNTNNASIAQFIELAQSFKFGLRILGGMEIIAVWLTKMAAAIGIMWGTWKFVVKEALAQAGLHIGGK